MGFGWESYWFVHQERKQYGNFSGTKNLLNLN